MAPKKAVKKAKKVVKKAAKKPVKKVAKKVVKKAAKKPVKKVAKKVAKKKVAKKKVVKKVAKKKAPKKAVKKVKKPRKPNPAFMKPMTPSAALAAIIGADPVPRTEVTKRLWVYIKKHGLQDAKDKRTINADPALKAVFGGKSQVSMFEMTKLISKHLK